MVWTDDAKGPNTDVIPQGSSLDLGSPDAHWDKLYVNEIIQAGGTNQRVGTATLVNGTVTVLNTSVTADTTFTLTHKTIVGTPGFLSPGTVVNGTSFIINSTNANDNSTILWLLNEAV